MRRAGRLGLIFTTHPVSSTSPRSSSIAVISGVLSACPCPLALARDRHLSGSAAAALPQAAHQRGSVRSAALAPADRRARTRHRLTWERGIAGRALRENLCRSCTQRAFAHHAVAPVDQAIDRRRTPPLCTGGFGRGSEKGGEGGTIRSIASSGWRADSAPPSTLRNSLLSP